MEGATMAHTDKDQAFYAFKHHDEVCTRYRHFTRAGARTHFLDAGPCECDCFGFNRGNWDPKFDDDCCRQERSRAAHVMRRARAGHLDWDDLTFDSQRLSVW
jgi:hypothetical protein